MNFLKKIQFSPFSCFGNNGNILAYVFTKVKKGCNIFKYNFLSVSKSFLCMLYNFSTTFFAFCFSAKYDCALQRESAATQGIVISHYAYMPDSVYLEPFSLRQLNL